MDCLKSSIINLFEKGDRNIPLEYVTHRKCKHGIKSFIDEKYVINYLINKSIELNINLSSSTYVSKLLFKLSICNKLIKENKIDGYSKTSFYRYKTEILCFLLNNEKDLFNNINIGYQSNGDTTFYNIELEIDKSIFKFHQHINSKQKCFNKHIDNNIINTFQKSDIVIDEILNDEVMMSYFKELKYVYYLIKYIL